MILLLQQFFRSEVKAADFWNIVSTSKKKIFSLWKYTWEQLSRIKIAWTSAEA